MEAIGAVAAVLQVAQIGTQLSIALYQISSSISSAAKHVKYIAKDIALFSAVLKDLSRALDLGSKAKLFRQDAFDTSIKIVGECKNVFTDIEDILKRVSKDDAPLHRNFEVPRSEKVLWYFRKGKVEFLRGVLESLKSTILLELAVLNYATKVSSPLTKDTVDVDELLALKSLVLANETSTNDLRELAKTQDGGETSLGRVASEGVAMYHHSLSSAPVGFLTPDAPACRSQHPTQIEDNNTCPVFSESTRDSCYPVKLPVHWTRMDRFEFALQRFNLAKWEHERIEENVALRSGNNPSLDNPEKEEYLLGRLRADMTKFGLDQSLVERALKILQKSGPWDTGRTEIRHITPKTESTMEFLELAGMPWAKDQNDASALIVRRWLPDMFGDVLWEHTQNFLRQKGLIESVESRSPTTSEMSTVKNSSAANPENRKTINAGTQTDHPKAETKSILRNASSVSMPRGQHLSQSTQRSGSGPQGRETSSEIFHSTPARSGASRKSDKEDIYSGRPNIGTKGEISEATTRYHTEPFGIRIPFSEQELAKERDIETRKTHTAEWVDLLPEPSVPFPWKVLHRSDLADDRGTKRRRVDLSCESVEQRDPNEHTSLDEHLVDVGTDAGGEEDCGHDPDQYAIMARPSQRPQARNAPESSKAAIEKFKEYSYNANTASIVATAGSEESEFDFALYGERRQEGIEGRERFFRQERDKVLRSVDGLLRRWTFIDTPLAEQVGRVVEPALVQGEYLD